MGIRLRPLRLALSGVQWRGLDLLTHQAAALAQRENPRLLVEAPTGGGKTWTAAVPLIDGLLQGEGAIFAYPTNALAEDQQDSLVSLLRRLGRPTAIVQPDGTCRGDGNAEVLLWRLDSNVLDDAQDATRTRRRGEAISRLLQRIPARPLWIITNPDTLFLLSIARYWNSPQVWGRLAACNTLVMDEFHLYTGPTLVRALLLIELAKHMMGIPRVRLLSATLTDGLRTLLKERLGFETIEAEETGDETGRMIQHPVTLEIAPTAGGEQAGDYAVRFVCDRLPVLRTEVSQNGIPLVVLRQSVLAAASLEDELARRGLERDEIGIYRGLTSRRIRSMARKTLVIGTSALEVGVDFRTSRLLFEALSSVSFIQRLGRVGRHEPGEAHFITDHRVARALASMPADTARKDLFARIRDVLAADDDLVSFPTSRWAGVVAFTALAALVGEISRLGGSPEFEGRLLEVERAMTQMLGTTSQDAQRAVDNPKVWKRLAAVVGFRGGSGSVEVFDVRERDRRGSPELAEYEIDLPSFFARAKLAPRTEQRAKPIVVGYLKKRLLHLETSLKTAQTTPSLNAPEAAQMELRVDGQVHPYESLLRDELPVVGFFPRQLRGRLSWREDVFESSDGRIALLNDDALKAMFLLER